MESVAIIGRILRVINLGEYDDHIMRSNERSEEIASVSYRAVDRAEGSNFKIV